MTEPAAPSPLPRQLVVCCDGTNNTLTAHTEDTNVLRLYEHLKAHCPSDAAVERLYYYDPGVGSPDSVPPTDAVDWVRRITERLSGLASGRGVYDNIAEAYRFLMLNWRDDRDRIYCFGFSRGAFTARCVVGMVHLFGLLSPEHEVMLPTLIRVYFSLPEGERRWWQSLTRRAHRALSRPAAPGSGRVTRDALAQQIRDAFTSPKRHDAWVHWVGVWDTVESVGLPGPLSRSNPSTTTFADKRIRHVRHALAFDEHRWTFEPRLYEEPRDITVDAVAAPPATTAAGASLQSMPARSLRQRWFPGAHCDVGGGYRRGESGLADAALAWMADELAQEFAVLPPPVCPAARRLRHDPLFDTPWWALAGMCLRDLLPTTAPADAAPQSIEVIAAVVPEPDESVWDGRRKAWPLAAAAIIGIVCLLLSGQCLLPGGAAGAGLAAEALAALQAARDFSLDQLAALGLHGLWRHDTAARWAALQPAWAMFWDCGFAACYGYLVARVASRAFAWLAGVRRAGAPNPWWRWLGMMPLAFVGGDLLENLLTLAALGWRGLDTDSVAAFFWRLGGWAALAKFIGALGCLPLLAIRLRIALPGAGRTAGHVVA